MTSNQNSNSGLGALTLPAAAPSPQGESRLEKPAWLRRPWIRSARVGTGIDRLSLASNCFADPTRISVQGGAQ